MCMYFSVCMCCIYVVYLRTQSKEENVEVSETRDGEERMRDVILRQEIKPEYLQQQKISLRLFLQIFYRT